MNRKILVVDDEENVRIALRTRLAELDCEVLEAGNPDDARHLLSLHRQDIAVVILDLKLLSAQEKEGHESGLKFLNDALGLNQACLGCDRKLFSPKVIVLTAYTSVASCRAAFLDGVLDYLSKTDPDVWKTLLERVKQVLEQPRQSSLFAARNWVENHFDEFRQKYGGKTLALQGETVVESADTPEGLKKKLESRQMQHDHYFLVTILTE